MPRDSFPPEKRERRDVLRIANPFGLQPINPVLTVLGFASAFVNIVSDGLVEDYKGDLLLAESIDSKDAKVWHVRIRPNLLFHDGSILTSTDVIHTINLARHSHLAVYEDRLGSIDSIREISPREIEITLSEPNTSFPRCLSFGILPARHFPSDHFNEESFVKDPVATGPYRLVHLDERVARFERFDQYFRGKPTVKMIEALRMSNKEEAWVSLTRNQVDLLLDMFTDAEALSMLSPDLVDHPVDPPYGYALALPYRSKIFSDRRIRQAVAYAIDRPRLLQLARSLKGPSPEWIRSALSIQSPTPFVHDFRLANHLLDTTGWKRRAGEQIRKKGEELLHLPLLYSSHDELSLRAAQSISRDLMDIGVDVAILPRSHDDIVKKKDRDYSSAVVYFYPPYMSADRLRDLFHSTRVTEGYNFSGFSNAEVDRLLDQAQAELSIDSETRNYSRVLDIVHTETPSLFLFWRPWSVPMHRCWKNVSFVSGNLLSSVWRWQCELKDDSS